MKTVLSLLVLFLVTACSHPLEIAGEGDIISSNGMHNCSLEEQPCSNYITGDYNVTYKAEPRAGWRFDGWEGCGDQFPGCTFNIPRSTVDQFIGQVAPPLRAVFSREPARKKVIIILDDSGSMGILAEEGRAKPPYDPTAVYRDAGFDANNLYFSTGPDKPTPDTEFYVAAPSNRCESSFSRLATEGNFRSRAVQWVPADGSVQIVTERVCNGTVYWQWCVPNPPGWELETGPAWVGVSAGWQDLSFNDHAPLHVDCQADVLSGKDGNGPGQPVGFPNQPTNPDALDDEAYTVSDASNVAFDGPDYNWFTAHYLNWFYDTSLEMQPRIRLDVLRDTVNSVVSSQTTFDFGLALFNDNSDGYLRYFYCGAAICSTPNIEEDNGGRIVQALLNDMTAADRNAFVELTSELSPSGSTPLAETVWEVYRYLTGAKPSYGNKRDIITGSWSNGVDPVIDEPAPDPRAYTDSTRSRYQAPRSSCGNTHVILVTDGNPTLDTHANPAIETLTGRVCADYLSDEVIAGVPQMRKNCLPELTRYMANNNLNIYARNGDQFGVTHTIGFYLDSLLLQDAATNGKGRYLSVNSAEELEDAFDEILAEISATEPEYCN
jgi:type IV pilus assembly protein PilY1